MKLYSSGEVAPAGVYVCGECCDENPKAITLKTADVLPDCPKCGGSTWVKS